MLNGRNLVIDTMSEVYQELKPYRSAEFWNFYEHEPIPNSVYVLGRQQTLDNREKFVDMAHDNRFVMVFGNSAEGSSTLIAHLQMLDLEDLVKQGRVLLISGGDLDAQYPYLLHDHFIMRIMDYKENVAEMSRSDEIFAKTHKPYQFLFLNGRARSHRKYLWERFRMAGLLDQAVWTMLDGRKAGSRLFRLIENGQDVMDANTPIRPLPAHYEVARYSGNSLLDTSYPHQYVKPDLFNHEWGEIYLRADAYIDTYFSVVTETVIDYPYSFRTEKIAKVLAMGHPWICATNQGFYRDIRNLGFKTFDGIVDESFDGISDNQARMDRIVDIVTDLCRQDKASFLRECEPICKYNQHHISEMSRRIHATFAQDFFAFLNRHRP